MVRLAEYEARYPDVTRPLPIYIRLRGLYGQNHENMTDTSCFHPTSHKPSNDCGKYRPPHEHPPHPPTLMGFPGGRGEREGGSHVATILIKFPETEETLHVGSTRPAVLLHVWL